MSRNNLILADKMSQNLSQYEKPINVIAWDQNSVITHIYV